MAKFLRKAIKLIGPYPYNPTLIFLFFSAFYFSRFIPVIVDQPKGLMRYETAAIVLSLSVIPSFFFALLAHLVQKYRRWSSSNLLLYFLEVSFGQSVLFLSAPFIRKFLKNRYDFDYQAPLTLTPGLFFGSLTLVIIVLGLIHRAERTVVNRLLLANQLIYELSVDREELVRADEAVRQQTSRFLHDHVQADLMVVAMELKATAGKSTEEIGAVIKGAISRLESSRTNDLKDLVQILAPDFAAGGLTQAIQVLSKQYETTMKVNIQVDEKSELLDQKTLLGLFRIIEQSLINSLVHGPAKRVDIAVKSNATGVSELVVSDDGPGVLLADVESGTGSAIIDSWVSILQGIKKIDSVPGHGYRLQVTFPR